MRHDWLADGPAVVPKGLAPGTGSRTLREIAAAGESLFGGTFAPPVMVLKASALDGNIASMARFCRDRGVELAPHAKTTMAPQIFERQLAAGAWGMTAATPGQVAVLRAAGVPHIVLANEVADRSAAASILRELAADPGFEFLCYVDSPAGVELLADAIADVRPGRPVDVLLEMGFPGGRTGCRSIEQALEVGRAAAAKDGVRVVGVAGFEGGLGRELTDEVFRSIDDFLESIRQAAEALADAGLLTDRGDGILLSAGGSLFFDRVVEAFTRPMPGLRTRCLLRCGCYVSHDSGQYERLSPFTRPGADPRYRLHAALEAWGQVLSVPEPGLAIVSLGRRDVPFDLGLPVPGSIRRPSTGNLADASGCDVTALNDQHMFVRVPPAVDAGLGDWLSAGISHPCTAFDKWQVLPLVDDDYRVIDLIRTFF